MNNDAPILNRASETCDRCGSILVVFEEHPDGEVIFCACPCRTGAGKSFASPVGLRSGRTPETGKEAGSGQAKRDGTAPRPSPTLAAWGQAATRNRRPAAASPVSQAKQPVSGGSKIVMTGAFLLVLVAALGGFWAQVKGKASVPGARAQVEADPDAAATAIPASRHPSVEIKSDKSGAITLVAGNDPVEVFRGFCRHPQFRGTLVPGNIQASTPPSPDRLVGTALLLDGTGVARQWTLNRDPSTKRWSIGDGKSAIVRGSFSAAPASSDTTAR